MENCQSRTNKFNVNLAFVFQGVFNSSVKDNPESLNVYDCGPIEGWWITGKKLEFGKKPTHVNNLKVYFNLFQMPYIDRVRLNDQT